MIGQYSNEEFEMEHLDDKFVERILWLLNKVKEDRMNGSVTLRFLNGKNGKNGYCNPKGSFRVIYAKNV